jgi:cysteine desulfurase
VTIRHYLDYNATAPVRPEARLAVDAALGCTGNPSSVHGAGRAVRALVETSREAVAQLSGAATPTDVVFTGSGTEANNLALRGLRPARILASAIEHPSVLRPAAEQQGGFGLVPVDGDGVVQLGALEDMLAATAGDGTVLVTVMMANNETGVVQPVDDVVRLAHDAGALVHVDAVQAAGRIVLDFEGLGCDTMALSAHKIGGPKGIGALVVRPGLELVPIIRGGGQERGLRAGTENVPGIAGFGEAAAAVCKELADGKEIVRQRRLRDRVEAAVAAASNTARFLGAGAPRLANTSCISLPGSAAETQVIAFDLAGIAVSSGSACSSGKVEPSHVLAAMGVDEAAAGSAIRVSLGFATTEDDADAFIAEWTRIAAQASGANTLAVGEPSS